MSYRALFEGLLARLKRRRWGTLAAAPESAQVPRGSRPVDTGVQAFADELVNALASDAPIALNQPLKIKRNYVGPVFIILDDNAEAINYLAEDGTQTVLPDPLTKTVSRFDTVTLTESVSAVRS